MDFSKQVEDKDFLKRNSIGAFALIDQINDLSNSLSKLRITDSCMLQYPEPAIRGAEFIEMAQYGSATSRNPSFEGLSEVITNAVEIRDAHKVKKPSKITHQKAVEDYDEHESKKSDDETKGCEIFETYGRRRGRPKKCGKNEQDNRKGKDGKQLKCHDRKSTKILAFHCECPTQNTRELKNCCILDDVRRQQAREVDPMEFLACVF